VPEEYTRIRKGRCLCGAVRFIARGEPRWAAHCHCDSCRRATSAPIATYAGYLTDAVEWEGEKLAPYESSPGVERQFCARCGSPMSFSGAKWPDEIHLFAASFEEPDSLKPTCHVHVGEKLGWIQLADGLPRYKTTARDGPPLE
jgi:hypothetical protein